MGTIRVYGDRVVPALRPLASPRAGPMSSAMMHLTPFVTTVEQAGNMTREEAARAIVATLQTLSERITGGEARDIAALLPRELRSAMNDTPEPAEPFDLNEFIRRVATREGVDERTAFEHARAVFTALGVAVAPGELRDMAAQLPREYEPLLEAAGVGRLQAIEGDPLAAVARRTGLDPDGARRALEATLEALAVRISAGEVEDLADELPTALRPPLERGLAEAREARSMTADEFLARVAEREGAEPESARQHVRAVFSVLRDNVSSGEFADMSAQLSQDYAPLLAPA
jgi:uncharacterized protein (DUF2267 family)